MRRFFSFLSTLCLLAACQKAPELTITSPSSIELGVDGSSSTITFTANRDWSVRSSDSWVSVTPTSGKASDGTVTVSVRCNENTTYDDRSATITISMEELSQTVTVRQPANLGVIVPTQSYNITSDARSIEVEVQANVQYSVSVSEKWIKQTGTKGLVTDKLTFSIEENETYDARSATITIKPQNATVQEQVISVKQAQKDALVVKDTSFDMPYGGGEIEVKVEANVSFDVKPGVEWIHYVETKALSSSTIRLTVDENPTYGKREGKIEIKQKNGSLSHTITVKQAERIAVTSVTLDQTSIRLKEGETATLVATVKPDNATDKMVTWSSSDAAVASVDDTGKIMALKEGSAIITANAGEKVASCSITVYHNIPVSSITLNKTKLVLREGEMETLIVTIQPAEATNKAIIWVSNDDLIAEVKDGIVKAKKGGTTTITVTSEDGTISAVCNVVVIPKSIPGNQIWYTSIDGNPINPPKKSQVNANLVSNIYENEIGIMTFDRDLEEIGDDAFSMNFVSKLESIYLPETIVRIGHSAFSNQTFQFIDLPESVSEIGADAFWYCKQLERIKLPSGITKLPSELFRGCESLEEVILPEKLEIIGPDVFLYCLKLKDIKIPYGLKTIMGTAFRNCSIETIELPNTLITLGDEAFYGCTLLKEIVIPPSAVDIATRVFWGCESLNRVEIQSGITTLPGYLFCGCTSLKEVVLPKGVTQISEGSFHSTGLEHFTIPSTVVKIGKHAFSSCEDLLSITCEALTPPEIESSSDIFEKSKLNLVIYVPQQSFDSYLASEGWAQYSSIMKPY